MLQPNRTKYRKDQKGRNYGLAQRGAKVSFGQFGLKVTERGRLTARRSRLPVVRSLVTSSAAAVYGPRLPGQTHFSKPAEVRMGNGKGNPEFWVALVQPGRVIYELDGVDEALAREAFRLAAAKLPLKSMFVTRQIGQ